MTFFALFPGAGDCSFDGPLDGLLLAALPLSCGELALLGCLFIPATGEVCLEFLFELVLNLSLIIGNV